MAVFCLAPGREFSTTRLRDRYQQELRKYENVRYVWGGENCWGIDCSGLVRRGLYQALWKEGLSNLNPTLIRYACSLWWEDASARALAEEYRGQTRRMDSVRTLDAETQAKLLVGDLAITTDGLHVLAYLGNGAWIEADPEIRRVILLPTPNSADSANLWLSMPMNIVRWRVLEAATQVPQDP